MNNKALIAIVVLVLVGGGYFMMKGNTSMAPAEESSTTNGSMETSKMAANMVEIKDFAFGPTTLTVKVGDTVTWINNDVTGHSATADDGSFDTGVMSQGESGSYTFTEAGTYGYHCTPHPNMKGTIIVQ
jgi:plastocyanin